ncbi:MAG: ZIP family metal transporter [Rhodocyclaceae bacterium]
MSVLTWILAASLLGGALSVAAAALFAFGVGAARVPMLISYAIGALLGAAFLEVLPEAVESGGPQVTMATVLGGILSFFVLEKFVLWRHCHEERCAGHEAMAIGADHGRSGLLILIGDTFHNFVDGVLIAAAFMQDLRLGVVTAIAIIAHEIPQEVGDFVILLHSGYSRLRAFAYNLVSSLATVIGGLLAWFAFSGMRAAVPVFLALAAGSMIYVAVADLIPGLHKRPEISATLSQVSLIALGVVTISASAALAERLIG